MADIRGRLRMGERDIARLDENFSAARTSLAACHKPAFVFIAPNKQSIYPEMLFGTDDPYLRSRLDDVLDKLSPQTRAMLIDPRLELRAAKRKFDVPLYSATDTHWNQLGAFIAYRKIVDVLARANAIARPDLTSIADYNIVMLPMAGGDIAANILYEPGRYPDKYVSLESKTPDLAQVPVTDADEQVLRNPKGSGRLLIQGDSFSPQLVAFLALHFAEVHHVRTPKWPETFDGKLVRNAKPDVVIVEMVERNLPRLLVRPADLQVACNP
jgi:hypothetical protein